MIYPLALLLAALLTSCSHVTVNVNGEGRLEDKSLVIEVATDRQAQETSKVSGQR